MSELEAKVEALMRCVPKEQWEQMLAQVHTQREEAALVPTIHRSLGQLGTPAHVRGYRYLAYALELVVQEEGLLDAITKGLYPRIARKFDTTAARVERALRHAIELTWDRGDIQVLYSYFGNTVSAAKGKPTNSEFVAQISKAIRLGMTV